MFFNLEIFVDTIKWASLVLSFICFHLSNKVDKVLWFGEKLKLFSVNQIAKFIFNLNDKLNRIKTIKPMICQKAITCERSFFCCSEITSAKRKDVLFNFISGSCCKSWFTLISSFFPKANLIGCFILYRNHICSRI